MRRLVWHASSVVSSFKATGTGKSQTITNLIADYLGRGKRVLFVCEKRAALDVVFYRLKQSGLDSLCSLIHDSQGDKKAFIADLKKGYEAWMSAEDRYQELAHARQILLAELEAYHGLLAEFENAMAQSDERLGTSARNLLQRLVSMPEAPQISSLMRESLPLLRIGMRMPSWLNDCIVLCANASVSIVWRHIP